MTSRDVDGIDILGLLVIIEVHIFEFSLSNDLTLDIDVIKLLCLSLFVEILFLF